MKINFAHLCDYALVSAQGKPSIMGLFRRIPAPKLPSVHLQCYLVFEIELHYTERGHAFDARVHCVDRDGDPILEATTTIEVPGKGKPGDVIHIPQILRLPPLRFTRDGPYDINIFLGTDITPKATVSFEVRVVTPPQAPPIQGKPPLPLPPADRGPEA